MRDGSPTPLTPMTGTINGCYVAKIKTRQVSEFQPIFFSGLQVEVAILLPKIPFCYFVKKCKKFAICCYQKQNKLYTLLRTRGK